MPADCAAWSLTAEHLPHVHPDHPLDVAMRRLAASRSKILPVVSRSNVLDLKGTLSLDDVLAAYAVGRSDAAPAAEPAVPPKSPAPLLATVLAIFVAIAILVAVLHYTYTAGLQARAQSAYEAGTALMVKESYEEAVGQYRNALSLSHSQPHRLALGLALVKAGHDAEALLYLAESVRQDPASGPAHLALAEIEARRGNTDQAVAHFQRAISGSWPLNAAANRFQARMELADTLWKAGRQPAARAELLSAVAGALSDPVAQKRLGRALIDYGVPGAAADLFHHLVAQDPGNAGGYDGLGAAEFAAGHYEAARDAWRSAVKVDPADAEAAKQADLCDRILELDPTLRGLRAADRYTRSVRLLQDISAVVELCGAVAPEDLKAARSAVALQRRPASYSDAAEADVALGVRLWKARLACSPVPADEALVRVMSALEPR
jgi:tetratricopeptide (TPR) repeat protein